jgi:hypothetical protein
VAPVLHPGGPLLVVALGDLADPVGPIANHARQFGGGVPLGEQPQDLPPGALVGLFRRAVAPLKLVDAQVSLEVNVSGHGEILPPPTRIPYHLQSLDR